MNDKYHSKLPLLKKYISFEVCRCVEYIGDRELVRVSPRKMIYKTTIEALPKQDDERDDEAILADYKSPVDHEGLPRLFWSVYGRTKAGFADALQDFDHADDALQVMLALGKKE